MTAQTRSLARRAFAAALILLLAGSTQAAGAERCSAPDDFPNATLLERFARGVNVPDWDDGPEEEPTVGQLAVLKAAGFRHVRLPIEDMPAPGPAREAYLDFLAGQIGFFTGLDLAVIVDLHAGDFVEPFSGLPPKAAVQPVLSAWRDIAARLAGTDPEMVAMELLNEPEPNAEDWRVMAEMLIATVRGILPAHTIVVGPSGPQRYESLAAMEPFADRNVVYAVHYYDPYPFTHQGANWGGPDDPVQHFEALPFPALAGDPRIAAQIAELRSGGHHDSADMLVDANAGAWSRQSVIEPAFGIMHAWSDRHDAPVIVNEFGVLDFTVERAARLDWLSAVTATAEALCIGWTHWDYQDGFGLIDPDTRMPDRGILDALTGVRGSGIPSD